MGEGHGVDDPEVEAEGDQPLANGSQVESIAEESSSELSSESENGVAKEQKSPIELLLARYIISFMLKCL